ncbi:MULTISPECIES: cation transporter [Lysobacteraceae]|nr:MULTISPECIES: cation transporter [Lysobacter]
MQEAQKRVLRTVMLINIATFGMMVGAAWYSRSSALLSGTLDNLGDAVTYALSLSVVAAGARAKARVAVFKGALISCAALGVAIQIGWRLAHPTVPIFEGMGVAAILNLAANLYCLRLLNPYRAGDVNMASAWECSRNDVFEGIAVIVATVAVWVFDAGWPDIVVAIALLLLFLRSAFRVLRSATLAYRASPSNT